MLNQSACFGRYTARREGYIPSEMVEFTHNILFDYAAFRCFVKPRHNEIVSDLASPGSWGFSYVQAWRISLLGFGTTIGMIFADRAFDLQRSSSVPILHKTIIWITDFHVALAVVKTSIRFCVECKPSPI